ncbi:hypothetical protein BDF14DRAFT_1997320 [Spinellus fusiger]|nr:hypothetical protein BDF14DRAFT_1997320 [Spinellus fusiger]
MSFLWTSGIRMLHSTKQMYHYGSPYTSEDESNTNEKQYISSSDTIAQISEDKCLERDELAALMISIMDKNVLKSREMKQAKNKIKCLPPKPPQKNMESRNRLVSLMKTVLDQIALESNTQSEASAQDIEPDYEGSEVLHPLSYSQTKLPHHYRSGSYTDSQLMPEYGQSTTAYSHNNTHPNIIDLYDNNTMQYQDQNITAHKSMLPNIMNSYTKSSTGSVPHINTSTNSSNSHTTGIQMQHAIRALSSAKLALEVERIGNQKAAVDMIISSISSIMDVLPVDGDAENKKLVTIKLKEIEVQHQLSISISSPANEIYSQPSMSSLTSDISKLAKYAGKYIQNTSLSDTFHSVTHQLLSVFSNPDSTYGLNSKIIYNVYYGITQFIRRENRKGPGHTLISRFSTYLSSILDETPS